MDAATAFGRVLRRLRLEAGLTQEQLGFEADLRRTYVIILELGQPQPTLTTMPKLAKPSNRSTQDIVGLVETESFAMLAGSSALEIDFSGGATKAFGPGRAQTLIEKPSRGSGG